MAACTIFDEDEVCMPLSNGGFKYGLVVESSEYVSSDEEDDDDEVRVQRGTVKVAWHPNGNESVIEENKLILADRSLMPGDIVRRLISGRNSQRGFVQNMHVKCHLKVLGTEQYIYNVDVRDVKPIQEWDLEPDVTLDSWVGHVIEVNEELTVKFPDGARCKVNANLLNLEDVNDKRETHSEFNMRNFYPGQELEGSVDDFEEAAWIQSSRLRGPKKLGNRALYEVPVVVEKVKTKSVDVRWICKGFTKTGAGIDKLITPPVSVEGDDLKRMKRLDCFDFCHRQIGDKGFYTIKQTDVLVPNLTPRKYVTPDVFDKISKDNGIVLGTNTNGLLVLRQDSQDSKGTDGSVKSDGEVDPQEGGKGHENGVSNVTEDITEGEAGEDELEEVGSEDDDNASNAGSSHAVPSDQKQMAKKSVSMRVRRKHKGRKAKKKHKKQREVKAGDNVAIEIFYTFSQCDVMWQDGIIEVNIPSPELFPIHHLDELEFFPGDFVVESKGTMGAGNTATEYGIVTSCDHKERTVMVKWMKPYKEDNSRPEEREAVELSVYDIKDHPDYKFRAGHTVIRIGGFEENTELEAVGQVFKLDPSGVIHVWWPDGTMSQNYPQDLYIISEEFNSEEGSSDEWTDLDEEEEEDGESDSDSSWETEEEIDAEEEISQDNSNMDAKKKPVAQPWLVNDKKKKDLDELLLRLQQSVSGLLAVFLNVPGPFFKNSKLVFQDILAIFKRCKELERILKSSFFNDDEISDLIHEIKEQLRKEKTTKLVKHVTSLYQTRTGADIPNGDTGEMSSLEKDKCVLHTSEVDGTNDVSLPSVEIQTLGGAEGWDVKIRSGQVIEADAIRKALIDYSCNITDPLLQIIFDTSLHLTVAKSRAGHVTEGKKCDEITDEKLFEICQSSETSSRKETALKHTTDVANSSTDVVNHGQSVSSGNDHSKLEKNQDLNGLDNEMKASLGSANVGDEGKECKASGVSTQKDVESKFPQGHRDLCIRVCKALSPRLKFIQQEIMRRWLAYKFGCDENATGIEVIEEMQLKMIESVESGNGPLRLPVDKDDEVGEIIKDHMERNVKELERLTNTRDLEAEISRDSSIEKSEESLPDMADLIPRVDGTGYVLCEETPGSHRFKNQSQKPANLKAFHMAVNKELMLLQSSLPDGIIVKSFEDRMDLFSALIKGPANTPYEDGLFVFDIQLPANYPSSPPVFHYHSFCSERLNPNLYEDGKVCVSLLGTWTGKGNEVWTSKSNLLQVLVSIQGLILVNEPYFNEAGYEKQRNTQHGQENSRMYNEMAILKLIQSMSKMALNPPAMFVAETESHLQTTAHRMISRVEHWIELSQRERSVEEGSAEDALSDLAPENQTSTQSRIQENGTELAGQISKPDFPLLPASKGFCLTVTKYLEIYKTVLSEHILRKPLHSS